MKIFITGSQGLLGRKLQNLLELQSHHVIGIDLKDADITKSDEIIPYIMEAAPEIVIHCAAMTDLEYCEKHEDETYLVNSFGTKNIALACQRINAELVFISSDQVFNGKKTTPYLEWDTPDPLSIYGFSKKLGEEYVQQLVARYYIVRTAGIFVGTGHDFVNAILTSARKGKALRVVNDEVCNRTRVQDLVEALASLIHTRQYGMYHIVNRGVCSWYDFSLDILRYAGMQETVKITPVTAKEYGSPVPRPVYSALNTIAYETVTGQKMRSYKQALKECIKV